MKTVLCLAAIFIITSAAPYHGSWEDSTGNRAYLEMIYGPQAEMEVARGDAACIRFPPKANDVISRKFMRDHICLYRGRPPFDLDAFCRDFRQGPPRYQVMLLTNSNIRTLRNDLQSHQRDFYNDRYGLRPL